MRLLKIAVVLGLLIPAQAGPAAQKASRAARETPQTGIRLEELSWTDAERHLTPDAVVVLPLGAAAKEHGPHLKLRNDLTLAEYLAGRVVSASSVVLAPPMTYHFYPAFLEYPGSTSLAFGTARDLTAEIVRSLARSGPRRFYVLNTGISTLRPLDATAKALAAEGILLRYTNLEAHLQGAVRSVQQQPGGTHADEIETSIMLHIDPSTVDMSRAVRDYVPAAPGAFRLTRVPGTAGTLSRTGIWGDPTLATAAKGRVLVEALVSGILSDLDDLRRAALPQATAPPPAPDAHRPPEGLARPPAPPRSTGCLEGDERAIHGIGPAFSLHWTNQDAQRLAALWAAEGDIAHPDGSVERTSQVIRQNRAYLFSRPEYRDSRHSLRVGNIRCLTTDVAVADGKWELREMVDANRRPLPPIEGLLTMVLKRSGDGWGIEAYRYTVTPRTNPPPTVLKQPGFISR